MTCLSEGGEDYESLDKNLTFAVGLGTLECVHIPILNDDCLEEDEAFSVSISSDAECVSVNPAASNVQINITDDDGMWEVLYTWYI